MPQTGPGPHFDTMRMTFHGRARDVKTSSAPGRPVIVMHELYGLTPEFMAFCELLVAEGFKVYAPIFFGPQEARGKDLRAVLALPCVAYEFRVLSANEPGPWADWVRALAAHAFKACAGIPGKGVGVIGLCLTGNLALSAALSPVVTAPVACEPSLPLNKAGGLHVSGQERAALALRVQQEGLVVRGYRFRADRLCKAQRFQDMREALGPDGFHGTEIPTTDPKLHSVFTHHLRDETGGFRHNELQSLVDFLRERI